MPRNLSEQVLKTIKNYDMVEPHDVIMAAVSGGPDSVFLLHVLSRLRVKLNIKDIVVANLDHGLRGKESRADSLFVKKTSKALGFKFIHKRVNLKRPGPSNLSTEERAREERYKFFREAAQISGANVIATGHTLDDQAETVLMRFIKGASLKGIVGIAPMRDEAAIRLIRPLIELQKDEIKEYLDEVPIAYRIDSTNKEPVYFRNVVRNHIIPYLEQYNPKLKRALFSLAEHLREDFEFIEAEKVKLKHCIPELQKGALDIQLKDIAIQPKALQKEILRDALNKAGGEVKRLSFRHWKELEYFIKYKRKGDAIDLPGGIRVERSEKSLTFSKL